ncbi:DUF2716 domain-containing protein [Streptomyces minutiscleroticus]|uniref:DUF2716 domain-containing protein n=1 Tax=Streptomyces minutiscleroticus TaxID=68238 RepID=UPI00167CDD2D|nr:DUF2716 domain-containing protein [Streptomyces minutiscleroticus]
MEYEGVSELTEAEYRNVWDRFYAEFAFRPSVNPAEWPAIKEPSDSVTWSLASLDEDPHYTRLDRFVALVEQGLTACVEPEARLFALDWQHISYSFAPHRVGGQGQRPWPLSTYPDGDYYIYLSADFRLGSFGHPWESTVCLFGRELLNAVANDIDDVLGPPLRRAGRRLPAP